MVDPSDDPILLEYAGLHQRRDRPPSPTDAAVGVLSGLQVIFATVAGAIAVASELTRSGNRPPDVWPLLGSVAGYAGLSTVAFVGSIRPAPPRRRHWYAGYLIGLPVLAAVLTWAGVSGSKHPDPGLYWQPCVGCGITDPAWLLLVVRGVRLMLSSATRPESSSP